MMPREPTTIPCCDRCGEPTEDGRERRSITGERLCGPCIEEEEQDMAQDGDEYVIGLGKGNAR